MAQPGAQRSRAPVGFQAAPPRSLTSSGGRFTQAGQLGLSCWRLLACFVSFLTRCKDCGLRITFELSTIGRFLSRLCLPRFPEERLDASQCYLRAGREIRLRHRAIRNIFILVTRGIFSFHA
eukprot:5682724-Karenia_brevis.AAC.1